MLRDVYICKMNIFKNSHHFIWALVFILLFLTNYSFAQKNKTERDIYTEDSMVDQKNQDSIHTMWYLYNKKTKELDAIITFKKADSSGKAGADGMCIDFKNGKISRTGYAKGNGYEFLSSYFESGGISYFSQNINDSMGIGKNFYENGNIKSLGAYKHDSPIGKWLYYYANGFLKEAGNYIQIKVTDQNTTELFRRNGTSILFGMYPAFKDGQWKYYNDDGKLGCIEFYNEVILLNKTEY